MATNKNLPPNVVKQLAKDLKKIDENPPQGIKVCINDDNFSTIFADIEGPGGTPYENGVFRMKLLLSHDHPHSPPTGYFLTKIFHPNIATNGEICVNALKKDWNPTVELRDVLVVIRCLLIEPFPESALNEQAAKLLLENYDEYAKQARMFTGIHAVKPKPKPKTGAMSESTTALNVDQSNTSSAKPMEQKNTALPSPLAPKPENGQDQTMMVSSAETGVSGLKTASTMVKKDVVGSNRVTAADKKKVDAKKKSLKRL